MKEKSFSITLPIYDTKLEFVATSSIVKSQIRKSRKERLGLGKPMQVQGLFCYNGPYFCILIDTGYIDNSVIAHEIFHATHRILSYSGVKFNLREHEAFSHLNGYLHEIIYKHLKKWNIKLK